MGWQIMGTEHLGVPNTPSNAEIAERTIDWLENIGYPLLPWQAEALRAMLTYPVDARFYGTARQHPQRPGVRADLGGQGAVDGVSLDEIQRRWWRKEDEQPPQPGMVKVQRNGEWVWETPCPCNVVDDSRYDRRWYDWRCGRCGTLHKAGA